MTQTVGYWCDECRRKYVQHKCREGLPCGHDKQKAIYVYAKKYARGREAVRIELNGHRIDLLVEHDTEKKAVGYMRSVVVDEAGDRVTEGEWLTRNVEGVRRAYLKRWESLKTPPDWRLVDIGLVGKEIHGVQQLLIWEGNVKGS